MTLRRIATLLAVLILLAAGAALWIAKERREHAVRKVSLARDRQLVSALATIRGAIANFRAQTGRSPSSLQELVPQHLPRIPVDPITGSDATWQLITEETVTLTEDFTSASTSGRSVALLDVRSGAKGSDPRGRLWSDY